MRDGWQRLMVANNAANCDVPTPPYITYYTQDNDMRVQNDLLNSIAGHQVDALNKLIRLSMAQLEVLDEIVDGLQRILGRVELGSLSEKLETV